MQGILVFADATARDAAITSPEEGQFAFLKDTNVTTYYTGSAWANVDTTGMTNPMTTTGDVIYSSSGSTPARLGIGTAGQVLQVNSGATAPEWAAPSSGAESLGFTAGKNRIINGDFFVNQRGFTSTTSDSAFIFDRFVTRANEGTSTFTAETFTLGTAPVSGYEFKNFLQIVSTGQTGTFSRTAFMQPIESVRTFAGQTATISFWAKATSGTPSVACSATQVFGSGGSPSSAVDVTGQKVAITTSWARYSFTFAIPSISGKTIGTNNNDHLRFFFYTSAGSDWNTVTDSLGIQSTTIQFAGLQLEAGSTATAFQTATGTIQGELAACQRYYWRSTVGDASSRWSIGSAYSTTQAQFVIPLKTTMRVKPSAVEYAGTIAVFDGVTAVNTTGLFLDTASTDFARITITVSSGLTQFRPYEITSNNSSGAYLAFISEL
jgi:hypothetical protein